MTIFASLMRKVGFSSNGEREAVKTSQPHQDSPLYTSYELDLIEQELRAGNAAGYAAGVKFGLKPNARIISAGLR
ncbi:hypothetical protein [Sphingomonas sp.]|uniref:hypothetical protein n=1 Tax=Sphingomonas sp. TaxID=28214 RepID=UPI0028AFA447|nr:hypothetical protein [Sphingomonas sp.]